MSGARDSDTSDPRGGRAYRWPRPGAGTRGRIRFLDVFVCTGLVVLPALVLFAGPLLLMAALSHPLFSSVALIVLAASAVLIVRRFRLWRVFQAPAAPTSGEVRGLMQRTVGWHTPALGMAALAGAVAIVLFAASRLPTPWIVVASLADAVPLLWAMRILWQGGIAVRWLPETLVAGGRATFFVETTAGGSRLAACQVMLRCAGPRDPADARSFRVVLWSCIVASEHDPGPEEPVIVTFDLPTDAPAAAPPVDWDLVVQGRTMWGVVRESFVVPVGMCPPAPVAAGPEETAAAVAEPGGAA